MKEWKHQLHFRILKNRLKTIAIEIQTIYIQQEILCGIIYL